MVVDDLADNREIYSECLQHLGLHVIEAVDGQDAIAKARTELPNLIVMDLSMPNMDGWEAMRRLKEDPATRDIPIIVLTGYGMAGHAQATLAGCDAYLVKPCLPDDLAGVVMSVLGAHAIDRN